MTNTFIFILIVLLDLGHLAHLLTKYLKDKRHAEEFWATLIASIIVFPFGYYLFILN